MNFIDKFIKQFFIVFAVMLMLGGGFLANIDNLLFLQKVEASEIANTSNLSTVEKTAVFVYRTISGIFGDTIVVETVIVDETNTQNTETQRLPNKTQNTETQTDKNEVTQTTTTVVTNPIREVIKEVVVERVIQTSGITLEDLQKLNNELRSEIYKLSSNTNSQITNTYQVISASNNIDNLGSVTITNSNISSSNVSGTELNFTNGNISNLTIGSAIFDTDTLVVDSVNNRVGIGTTSPYAKLSVVGDGHFDGNITASNITATSSIYLANTTNANQSGIIYKNGTRFIHNFNYGNNGTVTTEGRNTFLGENAGNLTMGSTATYSWESSYNTGVGYQSLYSNTKGYDNSALGYRSLYSNTEGGGNSAFGYYSLYSNTTGSNNVGDGYWSLYTNTSGSENVGVGFFSLWANTTGSGNTSVGDESMIYNTTGYQNAVVGQFAMYSNTTGFRNVAVGQSALFSKTTGNYNIGLGYRAGYGVTTASNNLFLGNKAGDNVTTGANNLIIGYDVDAPSATASNQLNIGNLIFGTGIDGTGTTLSSGNIGVGTTSPNYKLTVTGTVALNALPNDGTGYYLCAKAGTGELATSTTACGASSERFKTNIENLTYGLDTVMQLRPVSFDWKEDFIKNGTKQIGFIAEEVDTLIPEIIGRDNDGTIMNLDYPKMTAVLVNAMQELISTLDERISNVLASVTELVADRIKARQEICIDDVCINKDQLKTLLENTNSSFVSASDSAVTTSGEEVVQNSTPPTITITGNNPATVSINTNYSDLGATAVDYQGNSLIVDTIDADKVDTTTAGEYIVTYTAFDGTNTATSTRTVLVEEVIVVSLESVATTTEPIATTTEPSL